MKAAIELLHRVNAHRAKGERQKKSLTTQSCPPRVSLKYTILNHLKKFKANKDCQKYL